MHPHLLLTTADTIIQERLAHAARRRLVPRRRRATTLDGVGERLARFGATARRRAGSVRAPEGDPVTCTGGGGAWST